MRINQINNVHQVYNKNKEVNKIKENTKAKADQLNISDDAKSYQFAMSKINQGSDMRMDKVNKIKEEVNAGTYEIKADKIAEKLIDDVSFNQRI